MREEIHPRETTPITQVRTLGERAFADIPAYTATPESTVLAGIARSMPSTRRLEPVAARHRADDRPPQSSQQHRNSEMTDEQPIPVSGGSDRPPTDPPERPTPGASDDPESKPSEGDDTAEALGRATRWSRLQAGTKAAREALAGQNNPAARESNPEPVPGTFIELEITPITPTAEPSARQEREIQHWKKRVEQYTKLLSGDPDGLNQMPVDERSHQVYADALEKAIQRLNEVRAGVLPPPAIEIDPEYLNFILNKMQEHDW